MAESIIRGLLGNDTLNPENITVGDDSRPLQLPD